jgi:hypothetical protein
VPYGLEGDPIRCAALLASTTRSDNVTRGSSLCAPRDTHCAPILAHADRPQLIGLAIRTFTGWLDVAGDGTAIYAPHTSRGFVAPPRKKLLLVSNGLFAKYGLWQARRHGTARRLEQLAAEKGRLQGTN